jgi:hypothetical protein
MNTKNLEKNNNNFYWPQGLETKIYTIYAHNILQWKLKAKNILRF